MVERDRNWGAVEPEELERIVVVSPHLDDAVLGCGGLLSRWPGATVVTVFCGTPQVYPDPPTAWDRAAGFDSGDDVLAVRKAEDVAALAILEAVPRYLDIVEYQYLSPDAWFGAAEIRDALDATLRALEPSAVFAPFGLANPDHAATGDACISLCHSYGATAWFCYEDFGYKHIPGMLAWRISALLASGLWSTPAAVPTDQTGVRKAAAFACYESQVRALQAEWQVDVRLAVPVPEQHWRITAPPEDWQPIADSR